MTGDFPIVNESLGGRDVLPGAPYAYQPETISFLSHLLTRVRSLIVESLSRIIPER